MSAHMNPHTLNLPKAIVTLLAAALFGFGLMLVMAGAAGLALVAYKGFPRWLARPLLGGQFLTQPAQWNRQTLLGSAIFGIGWGLSGV